MAKTGKMYITKDVDVELEITVYCEDVCEYILHHAQSKDLKIIEKTIKEMRGEIPSENETLLDQMKNQLLIKAHKHYTLDELEKRLEMTYI